MDNNYNQQTDANSNQQGDSYPKGNFSQQGSPYQQGNFSQQGSSYPQGNFSQQGNSYQQGNFSQQGSSYQQGNFSQQGNFYSQGNSSQQGNFYSQGNFSQQGNSYSQGNFYQQPSPYMDNGYGNYGGNTEPQKAPNIFQQFALSFIPPQYDKLTKVKTGSMIGFVTLLALVATIISFVNLMIGFSPSDIKEWASELPDFEIMNGRLYVEDDFLYDEGNTIIYITDDISEFSYDDAAELVDEGYQDILLIGQDRISLMQDGQYQQVKFSDFGSGFKISRDKMVESLASIIMVVLIVGYVLFFVGRVFWYFLCAAVYLLFALLINSIAKKQQSAGELFRVAVYSKVLMFVVATLISILPFSHFSVPFLFRVVITVAFMGFAIANLPEKF